MILAAGHCCLLAAIAADNVSTADLVTVVESDLALLLAVLRRANTGAGRGHVDTALRAVELLGPQAL